jgi:glucose/arabinose dehydrogenase
MQTKKNTTGTGAIATLALLSMFAITSVPQSAVAQTSAANGGSMCEHAGLTLPPGFCATVFADKLGHARHLAAGADGTVYVNTWDSDYFTGAVHPGGFLIALKDSKGAGRADSVRRFGPTHESGAHGGTGIALFEGYLYAEIDDRIVRYQLPPGGDVPRGKAEVIVSGLPLGGDHPMHPFVIDPDGRMYIDVATATNACQPENRTRHSRGIEPCVELETRGGIWLYDAHRTAQAFSKAERYATGIRNAVGIALDASGRGVYVSQHGRDQLRSNWPELYKLEEEATQPAEELLRLQPGGDYGWPECYFDVAQRKLVLAPEYGGDGGKTVGVCAEKLPPVAYFPAHWAPDALAVYRAEQFPARYREGIFIAFHGSWDRAPYAQGGYNIVFQPLADGKASIRNMRNSVPPDWPSDRMEPCTWLTMCAGASTASLISPAQAQLMSQAKSWCHARRRMRRRDRSRPVLTSGKRRPPTPACRQAQPWPWWRLALVSFAVKSAARAARGVTAPTAAARHWGPALGRTPGSGVMVAMPA